MIIKFKSNSLETLLVHFILSKYVHWLPAFLLFKRNSSIKCENNKYAIPAEECLCKNSDYVNSVARTVEVSKEKWIRTKEMKEIWNFMI